MSRLLLVDDHVIVRDALRALLEAAGHQVVGEVDSPTPALAEIVRLQPDVVLLDLSLGERSGFEVLAELQRRKLGTRVVVLSMSSQPRHVAEALRLGAQGRRYLGEGEAELALQGLSVAGASSQDQLDQLSPRERQILLMVARGASSSAIGEALHLSPKTVDTYRSRLMAKLGLSDVSAIVRWCIRQGLLSVDEP